MMWDSVSDETKAGLAQELKDAPPVSKGMMKVLLESGVKADVAEAHVKYVETKKLRKMLGVA